MRHAVVGYFYKALLGVFIACVIGGRHEAVVHFKHNGTRCRTVEFLLI